MNNYQRKLKQKRKLDRDREKITLAGAEIAINTLCVLPSYVLAEEFGFGQKRLMRYMEKFCDAYTAVIKKQVSLETLADLVKDKGVVINLKNGEWKECKKRYIRRMKGAKNEKEKNVTIS